MEKGELKWQMSLDLESVSSLEPQTKVDAFNHSHFALFKMQFPGKPELR